MTLVRVKSVYVSMYIVTYYTEINHITTHKNISGRILPWAHCMQSRALPMVQNCVFLAYKTKLFFLLQFLRELHWPEQRLHGVAASGWGPGHWLHRRRRQRRHARGNTSGGKRPAGGRVEGGGGQGREVIEWNIKYKCAYFRGTLLWRTTSWGTGPRPSTRYVRIAHILTQNWAGKW